VEKYESIDIGLLKFDCNNARKHDSKNLSAIKGSLTKFGQQKPIVVTSENQVIAGNGTLEAAISLGWESIDIVRTQLKGKDLKAYGLADNRSSELASWDDEILGQSLKDLMDIDFDIGAIGFDVPDTKNEGMTDDDSIPDIPNDENPFNVERGQIWQLGNHRVMCGDSTDKADVDDLMNGEKADMVFTDPPYNVGIGSKTHEKFKQRSIENDSMTEAEFKGFSSKIAKTIDAMTSGCIYVFGPPGPDGRTLFSAMDEMFHCSTTAVWVKDCFVLGRAKYHSKYEPCWFGWNKDGKSFSAGRDKDNVWTFDRPKASKLHPTMKPIGLIEALLLHHSSKTIGDPFLGSGSTRIACEKTNRKCYGMEIDPHYCSVIIKRWQDFTGNTASLIES